MSRISAYLAFVLLLAAMTAAGYFVFLQFVGGAGTLPLAAVAVFAGIATFFSPCSFGLLPAYLSIGAGRRTRERTIKNGVSAAAGMVAFNALLGIVVALVGLGIGGAFSIAAAGPLSSITLLIRAAVGLALVLLGVLQFFHKSVPAGMFRNIAGRIRKGKESHFIYGFAYNLGNVGCTGPIMAGLILLALANGATVALLAFAIYSLTMGGLMLVISLLAGTARMRFFQEKSHRLMRISAAVLVIAGLFVLGTVLFSSQFAAAFFP